MTEEGHILFLKAIQSQEINNIHISCFPFLKNN